MFIRKLFKTLVVEVLHPFMVRSIMTGRFSELPHKFKLGQCLSLALVWN